MLKKFVGILLSAFVLVAAVSLIGPVAKSKTDRPLITDTVKQDTKAFGKIPINFEANQGQADARVKFISRTSDSTLFLTSSEAVIRLGNTKSILRMRYVGANPSSVMEGTEKLAAKSHYFLGKNPNQWTRNISHFAKVQYKEIYPGVDLVYYGKDGELEYDFVVAPGANPQSIALAFSGAVANLSPSGDLILKTKDGEIRHGKPTIYQEEAGKRSRVDGTYVMKGKNQIGFKVASYDKNKTLVIDPVISFSTYLGGSNFDGATDVAVDQAGFIYITGSTSSTDFPTTTGSFQQTAPSTNAFITKLSPDGQTTVYSTYLGGNSADTASGIAVDVNGHAYVTGQTLSNDFPLRTSGFLCFPLPFCPPFQSARKGIVDAFITKLSVDGSALFYSSYLGGDETVGNTTFLGFENGADIAVDDQGNAYVTGFTAAPDFPSTNPLLFGDKPDQDAFITKVNPSGTHLVYSNILGGSGGDTGYAVAVDSSGHAYVVGNTGSATTDFPTVPIGNPLQADQGTVDAFLSKFSANGAFLEYSTYLGGSAFDIAFDVAIDRDENVYVTGVTFSPDFPTTTGAFDTTCGTDGTCTNLSKAFVTKINATATRFEYSTYLGGNLPNNSTFGRGILVDSEGQAYVTGFSSSPDFPAVDPVQADQAGTDAFVTKLNPEGSALKFSTLIGGSGEDQAEGIALDNAGSVIIAGDTDSTDFLLQNARQGDQGGIDAFVTKISNPPPPPPPPPPVTDGDNDDGNVVTEPDSEASGGCSMTLAGNGASLGFLPMVLFSAILGLLIWLRNSKASE